LYNVYLADATNGDITFKFLGASNYNKVYVFKKIDNSPNIVSLSSNFAQKFDGQNNYTLTSQNESVTIVPVPAISGWVLN